MPVVKTFKISAFASIYLWKIEETENQLISLYTPNEVEMEFYNRFVPGKKLHFLACRVLLNYALPNAIILKTPLGKPYVQNNNTHISWSHSGNYAALIVNQNQATGIDIEQESDRVSRIQSKFINQTDAKSLTNQSNIKELMVIWGAKESMYKYYGLKQLDFKNHLTVFPFKIEENHTILGSISHPNCNATFNIGYSFIDLHVLVWINHTV